MLQVYFVCKHRVQICSMCCLDTTHRASISMWSLKLCRVRSLTRKHLMVTDRLTRRHKSVTALHNNYYIITNYNLCLLGSSQIS